KNVPLKEIELRLVAEKAGLIDGEVFYQSAQLGFALVAGKQAIVRVKRIQPADFQPPLQTVLQEVRPPLVKVHAAFLVNKRLQQLVLRFTYLDLYAWCGHRSPLWSCCRLNNGSCRLGFRNLTQPPQFAFLQNLIQVNQYDQPSIQLAYAGHVVAFTLIKHRRQFNLSFGDLQDF